MIKRSLMAAGVAAATLMSVAPAASAAEIQIGPWPVQVPDIAPVLVPIPMGSEAAGLPPLPFPLVWDLPVASLPAPVPEPAVAPAPPAMPVAAPAPQQARAAVYVANCTEARERGIAPIYRDDPAYRPALDRDNDGVACEPYRR